MLRPLHDYILIKKENTVEKIGNLYIPETAQEQSSVAEIVAVGPGTKDIEMCVSVGDKILISKDMGQDIVASGITYTLIKQENIISRIA